MQLPIYDKNLELEFAHRFGQRSVAELVATKRGDCFAYAKYRLLNQPWLSLFAKNDSTSGIHFGAVDYGERISLHHLSTGKVKQHTLPVDDNLLDLVASGQTLVLATKAAGDTYMAASTDQQASAVFFNTFEWQRVFDYLHENVDPVRVWGSTVASLSELSVDIL